jgi:hypothetical protein
LKEAATLLRRLCNVLIRCCLQQFERPFCPLEELLARHADKARVDQRIDLVEVALSRLMV